MTDERFTPASGEEVDPEAERIVAEIEVTRTEMEGTIGEIGHRLQPQTIASQARDQLREATVGKVERLMDDAGQTAQQTSNTMVETVRQNPVPAAVAALGIGWLAMRFRAQQSSSTTGGRYGNGSRQGAYGYRTGYGSDYGTAYGTAGEGLYEPRSGDAMSGLRDRADSAAAGAQGVIGDAQQQAQRLGENVQGAADDAMYRAQRLGHDVQSAARDVADQTQQTVKQAQWQLQGTVDQAQRQFDRTLQDNPLALGVLAVGVGAAVAMAIPETQKERELMGEQRDRLLSEAQSVASQALEQAEHKVEEVGEQVRSQS